MANPSLFKACFYCGQYYHLVFKSIDGLLLFRSTENKRFFLEKFSSYLNPVLECFAYCLLDNHAHFIVLIKAKDKVKVIISGIDGVHKTSAMNKFLCDDESPSCIDELIEQQINRFTVSYAHSYNTLYERKGGLFQSPFRRSAIYGENHLQQAIIYVHANAQKHGLVKDYRLWAHSSYREILMETSSVVNAQSVIAFFGGTQKFIQLHNDQIAYYYSANWPSSKIEVD